MGKPASGAEGRQALSALESESEGEIEGEIEGASESESESRNEREVQHVIA